MGQSKKLLFLGRKEGNSGYDYCVALCKRKKWKLVVAGGDRNDVPKLLQHVDLVFTTGYLGIVESFAAGRVVLVYADNPVKKDYLLMHPMAKYLIFDEVVPDKLPVAAINWAKQQTWDKVTDLYEQLWKK